MAKHIENKDIENTIEGRSYENLRPELKSGDILFCSGEHIISLAIRGLTQSPWSHVGIVLRSKSLDRVLLLESVEDMGVRLTPLSKYVVDYDKGKPYKGDLVIARIKGLKARDIIEMARLGVDELTRPYDVNEIARVLARIALSKGKTKRDREYICSELVHECFAHAGIHFSYDRRGFISPENIWTDERICPVARILH
jgi:hypothetical protein